MPRQDSNTELLEQDCQNITAERLGLWNRTTSVMRQRTKSANSRFFLSRSVFSLLSRSFFLKVSRALFFGFTAASAKERKNSGYFAKDS
jgi:hypothetical protein